MIDILFVNLPVQMLLTKIMIKNYDFSPSLGLMSLNTFVDFNGYKSEIIDLVFDNLTKNEFLDKVEELSPMIVGISAYTENIDMALRLAKAIKSKFPNIYVALGGAHISLCQNEFIENENIDFAIINEGECSIIELISAIKTNQQIIKFSDIDGIFHRENGQVHKNKKRDFIKDLDLIPIPNRDYFGLDRFKDNKLLMVSTSRGCPNKCIYCAANALSGKTYRVRNIENVFLEMITLQKLVNPMQLAIIDDSFTVIKSRVNKFLDLMEKYNATFLWQCESIITHMDEELLDRLSKNRLIEIQYGMESGNQDVLDKIQKGTTLEYAERIIKATQERKIVPLLSFIVGHYCETQETARQTIDFMKKASNEYDAMVFGSFNTPFPGTYQYEHMEELNMKLLTTDFRMFTLLKPVVYTSNFTEDDQYNWMYEMNNIANEKKKLKYKSV